MSGELGEKNSPGHLNVVPYSNSAAVQAISSLRAVRIPRKTSGGISVQCSGYESTLELAVEAFHQTICNVMVGCRVNVLCTKQLQ